ncbi:MAG: sigma-70 family RNA polymerase sigma factor [Proteobacteria bacterium]|nr:sigma-70 family RNA polymerase sigma factor [Pseudomonadota bacterium]
MAKRGTFEGRESLEAWTRSRLETYAREYGTALTRYFDRRGAPPEVSQDLVQEVFARLAGLTRKGTIQNGEAYLMRTASNVWIDYLRRKQRADGRIHLEYDDDAHSPAGLSPENVLESRQSLERVIRALEGLPARTRQIYLLCRVDGQRRRAVAKQFRISISAVDKHLMAATKIIGLAVKDGV